MSLSFISGALTAILIDLNLPLPVSLTINPPTVPVVVYSPVIVVMLTAWQLSLGCEPNESLSDRPVDLIRAGILLAFNLAACIPLVLIWYLFHNPWALVGVRNLVLVSWGTVVLQSVVGLRFGTATATIGTLLAPSITRTDQAGFSPWWALTEAPHTSKGTLIVVILTIATGLYLVLAGKDRRQMMG